MIFRIRHIGLVLLMLTFCRPAVGQSSRVRDEIRQAQAEISRINGLVDATRKEQGATLDNLRLVGVRIENRQKIVRGLETEIGGLSSALSDRNKRVAQLQTQLSDLKSSFAELVRISYRNHRENGFLSFILSSKSFSDAARRVYYVKCIGRDLERKAIEIKELSSRLGVEMEELKTQRTELTARRSEHAGEVAKLGEEQSQLKKTEVSLKGREKELLVEAEKRRRQITALEEELQRMVRAEMQKRGSTAVSASGSADFEKRRGNLPRPVDGVVVDRYGVHPHPTQKGVKITNKGINIAVKPGAVVSCVCDGEVRKVFFFQGLGNSVMVRHGNYLTIYANLGEVLVREGEEILEGQRIGSVAPVTSGQPMLHFELWKESDNLDPEPWIRK